MLFIDIKFMIPSSKAKSEYVYVVSEIFRG